ncbi:hypothetical protein Golomagni_07854, partial [Golovinomyces magnicellulatus]
YAIEEALRINNLLSKELGSNFLHTNHTLPTVLNPLIESNFPSKSNPLVITTDTNSENDGMTDFIDTAFPVNSNSNNCFRCNKKGHWANNCPTVSQNIHQNSRPELVGQPVTIKGMLYKNQVVKFSDKLKNSNDEEIEVVSDQQENEDIDDEMVEIYNRIKEEMTTA